MSGVEGLVERLKLLAAWRKPGGPTPKQKMPDTYTTVVDAMATLTNLQSQLAAREAEVARLRGEYICKCGLRVEPHRCRDTKGEF